MPHTCAATSAVEVLYTCPVASGPSQGTGRNSFTWLSDTPYVFSKVFGKTQGDSLKDSSSFPNNGTCDAAPTLASLTRAQERVSYQQAPANFSSYLEPMIDDSDEQYLADFHKNTMKATADWLSDHPGPSVVKDQGITQTDDSYAVEVRYTYPVASGPSQGTGRNSFTWLSDTPYVFSKVFGRTHETTFKDPSVFSNNGTCAASPTLAPYTITLASSTLNQESPSYQQASSNSLNYAESMKNLVQGTSNAWNKIVGGFESVKSSLFSKAPASLSGFANQGVSLLMQHPVIAGVSLLGLGCVAVKRYCDKVASEKQVALIQVKDLKKQNEFYKAVLRLIDPNFSFDKTKPSDDLTVDELKKQNKSLRKQLKELGITNKSMKKLKVAFLNNTLDACFPVQKRRG